MTIEALNCPNCGAGVARDSRQCDFCRTRLKTVGCPRCLGLMFIGSKFCGHCGAAAEQVEAAEIAGGDCPRCKLALEKLQIDEIAFRGCSKCDGLWIGVETFEDICADGERRSAVLGFLKSRPQHTHTQVKISYVPCPSCKQLMNRNNFGRASGVIVDTCKGHGVWCDAAELPAIIEFIEKGGMELARERQKMEIRDERDKLREERRKQVAFDRRFGTLESDGQIGIRSFLRTFLE